MDSFTFSSLESTYKGFEDPIAIIEIDNESMRDNRAGITISDIEVDLTCGFEAAQASFCLYDCYDLIESQFQYKKIKKYTSIGSYVRVSLGYFTAAREVFRGLIVRVEYVLDDAASPHVKVTAMDIKSIMMANHYHKRLLASNYSAAIKEIFSQGTYTNLIGPTNVITKLDVSDTPDVFSTDVGETADSIEMVGESDYEFCVRTAKKFNYEFYCIGGQVLFRPARGDVSTLLNISNDARIFNFNVTYDITGLVGKVTVRGLDVGKAKTIESSSRHNAKISSSMSAKSLFKDSTYVYVDPTISSKIEASQRCAYIFDDMCYRFGTLDAEIIGLPEVIPGRFVSIMNMGDMASNQFYVGQVQHRLDITGRYTTRIIGHTKSLPTI